MKETFNPFWTDLADVPTLEVADRIVTGVATMDNFKPDYETLYNFPLWQDAKTSILDFGAGMLRNTVGLLNMSEMWHVTAYDNASMLARGVEVHSSALSDFKDRFSLQHDWEALRTQRFDVVIALLCFQHILPDALRAYLKDLRQMTPMLCVHGRRCLDDLKTNLWLIVLEEFNIIDSLKPGNDPLNGDPFDHFSLVLQPRP